MKWIVKYELWTPNGTVFGSRPFDNKDKAIDYKTEMKKVYKQDVKIKIVRK